MRDENDVKEYVKSETLKADRIARILRETGNFTVIESDAFLEQTKIQISKNILQRIFSEPFEAETSKIFFKNQLNLLDILSQGGLPLRYSISLLNGSSAMDEIRLVGGEE